MAELDGSDFPISVDGETITLTAPGFVGQVTAYDESDETTRSASPAIFPTAFSDILDDHGFQSGSTLEIDIDSSAVPISSEVTRGPDGEAAMTLEKPWLGEDIGEIALCIDESGVATWHFPSIDEESETLSFSLRSPESAAESPDDDVDRGIIGISARLVKTYLYQVTDPLVAGPVGGIARLYDAHKRPYRLCGFAPGNDPHVRTAELTSDQLRDIGSGRALLFIHGTFSTTDAGFQKLPDKTLRELHHAYDGRVFAFDHPTISVDPVDNIREFLTMVPDDVSLDLDLLAHSRGGLVARTLNGDHRDLPIAPDRVRVGRTVFAGTPNRGSKLTSPEHLPNLIDRYTTALNVLSFGPVAEMLDAVIVAVKVLAHGVFEGLEGLTSADPDGEFMAGLAPHPAEGAEIYGLAADYAPPDPRFDEFLKARAVDNLMGAEHDLVVTAESVRLDAMTDGRFHQFPSSAAVHHSGYFEQAETQRLLREWLRG